MLGKRLYIYIKSGERVATSLIALAIDMALTAVLRWLLDRYNASIRMGRAWTHHRYNNKPL
jgi:hypothetical protein